jgi:hypothetical protein
MFIHDITKDVSFNQAEERLRTQKNVKQRGLCGLANDTKWTELFHEIQSLDDEAPSYRFKLIGEPASRWDMDWSYHLPEVLASIEWLDVCLTKPLKSGNLLPAVRHSYDHQILQMIDRVGFDHSVGKQMVRLFGYSPKDWELFDHMD